ncbi:DegT/DnrJ/EryC1/StrS family aminotransferase [bacterium]|nr:DegT/DnrJ/EryC1/StrS family aminotransferase [bacterium]
MFSYSIEINSKFCGSKYAISCSNGTDAITLSLLSLNLKKNSEVILPAMTYASTFYAIINAGLKPILVDINEDSPLISIKNIKRKINKNTKVIIPVHLYGSVVDINALKKEISKDIFIIDDCAQAHGAKFQNGKRVGGEYGSHISTFSLYPGKNLGAYGDAGIITTNSFNLFTRIKKIRNIGATKKFNHETIGYNNRMDTIQASILLHKLDRLKILNKKRSSISKFYIKKINNPKIKFLNYTKYAVFHQFVVRVKNRNNFINYMSKNKIETGQHYPHTINQMKFYKKNFKDISFPNSEKLAKECVSLPIDPMLKKKEINFIVKTINNF